MQRILIVAQESDSLAELSSALTRSGFACSTLSREDGLVEQVTTQSPDLILVETNGHPVDSKICELTWRMKRERPLPVVALVARETVGGIDDRLDVDDFLMSPYDNRELLLRVKRLLHRTGKIDDSELIKCEGLVIDMARCEVRLEGRVIGLTFKEYKLLKFLAGNRGRVYTREALLNKIWGYDYYGGDRTVDVHIRRLRSKIEDAKHTFIETV